MTQEAELPALPRPDLEDVDYELWGQNVKSDCWFEKKMRAYATAAVLAERERNCAALMEMHARTRHLHNYYHCAAVSLFPPPAKEPT